MKDRLQLGFTVLLGVSIIGLVSMGACVSRPPSPVPWPELPTLSPDSLTRRAELYVPTPVTPIAATTSASLPLEMRMVHNAEWAEVVWGKSEGDYRYDSITDVQVERIRKPEWEELWPEVHFYLTKRVGELYSGETAPDLLRQHPANPYARSLYAVYGGRLYGDSRENSVMAHFNELLAANGIEVTHANRELVVKAFILVAMGGGQIVGDVTFSAPRKINEEGAWPEERLTYRVDSWSQIQGVRYAWLFNFHPNGQIKSATSKLIERNVGEYIPVPDHFLLPGSRNNMWYSPTPAQKNQ